MDTYTPDQLAHLDPVAISGASPRHIQSVLEKLIATAQSPGAVRLERAEICAMLETVKERSNNSLFRSAITIAIGAIEGRNCTQGARL